MPLVSTRGCGPTQVFQPAAVSGGGGGGGGLYASADLYYDFTNGSKTSGSATGGSVQLGSYGSFSTDENGGGTVLQSNGGSTIKFSAGSPGGTHTISVWFRSNNNGNYGMLMSKAPTSSDNTYDLDIWDGDANNRIFANNGDGYGNPYSSSNGHRFNHNDWKNYVFTFDGGTARYWRDGTDYGTCPTYRSWNGYNGSWSIGTWTGPYFGTYAISNGRWKKFAAWHNTVLTSSQISDLYSAGL